MNRSLAPSSKQPECGRYQVASRVGLSGLLAGSGLLHILAPGPYRRIVPRLLAFGHTDEIVLLTGLAELGCAAAILGRGTRRAGALATVALFVAVFPANLKMAFDAGLPARGTRRAVAIVVWLRLPLQIPLILWARRVGAE